MSGREGKEINLSFIDVETTGLAPDLHRVLEFALVRADIEGIQLDEPLVSKFKLPEEDIKRAQADALAKNGYKPEEWEDAPEHSREFWQQVADLTSGTSMISQNVGFDCAFIEAEMARVGVKPKWLRRKGEITTLSMILSVLFKAKTWGLGDVYDALQGPPMRDHRALEDVWRGMIAYQTVMRLCRAGLTASYLLHLVSPGGAAAIDVGAVAAARSSAKEAPPAPPAPEPVAEQPAPETPKEPAT